MKAITIRQAWAGLIMTGRKTIEYRSWQLPGPLPRRLAVHAGTSRSHLPPGDDGEGLAFGAIVGTVEVVSCSYDPQAKMWHWHLRDPRPLAEPLSCKGKLKLWDVPAGLLPALEAAAA